MKEQNRGVAFDTAADGTRSTTHTGARIVAAALRPLNPQHANAALQVRHWRRVYPKHFRQRVECGLGSPEPALSSAKGWTLLRTDCAGMTATVKSRCRRPCKNRASRSRRYPSKAKALTRCEQDFQTPLFLANGPQQTLPSLSRLPSVLSAKAAQSLPGKSPTASFRWGSCCWLTCASGNSRSLRTPSSGMPAPPWRRQ
jgi:hypothetical protein